MCKFFLQWSDVGTVRFSDVVTTSLDFIQISMSAKSMRDLIFMQCNLTLPNPSHENESLADSPIDDEKRFSEFVAKTRAENGQLNSDHVS